MTSSYEFNDKLLGITVAIVPHKNSLPWIQNPLCFYIIVSKPVFPLYLCILKYKKTYIFSTHSTVTFSSISQLIHRVIESLGLGKTSVII